MIIVKLCGSVKISIPILEKYKAKMEFPEGWGWQAVKPKTFCRGSLDFSGAIHFIVPDI